MRRKNYDLFDKVEKDDTQYNLYWKVIILTCNSKHNNTQIQQSEVIQEINEKEKHNQKRLENLDH